MAAYIRQKPPRWFMPVAAALVAWGLMGCASFYGHIVHGPEMMGPPTDWDRAYYAALPTWLNGVYAIAVGGGLLGSVALLMRSKTARPLYIVSLAAVVVQFGYIFVGTDMIAHKGVLVATGFPIFIAAMAVFQIWFATRAIRRGWIS